jgi:DNA modification methylase
MPHNKIIHGDCLEEMRKLPSESVDLIYLDPPFFSNRDYEVVWGDEGEVRSFADRWAGGIEHYIDWLKERVREMYRLLKPAGSIYLHCDWHANANIRVDILDNLFGRSNFRNEIIWCYTGPGSPKMRQFNRKHDTIFWYVKGKEWSFNKQDVLMPYKGGNPHSGGFVERDGTRLVPDEYNKGKVPEDWWNDIAIAARFPKNSSNNIGYPTQKPEALLERIILASSNKGDVVLDPFVGGGTTIAVADRLDRQWIGIDQSVQAVKVTELRLRKQQDSMFAKPYELILRKYDYDKLRNMDAFEFEKWIIEQFGGETNVKQRSDLGIDGRMPNGTPIQVKRSDNVGRNVLDNFISAVQRYDEKLFEKNKTLAQPIGYILAFSFGKGAIEEVSRLKNKKNTIVELVKISDIVSYDKRPKVSLSSSEVDENKYAFEAKAESEIGIEFYSWDFDHNPADGFKPDVVMDKGGKQIKKFDKGKYVVAVEAVDKHGFDGQATTEIGREE